MKVQVAAEIPTPITVMDLRDALDDLPYGAEVHFANGFEGGMVRVYWTEDRP